MIMFIPFFILFIAPILVLATRLALMYSKGIWSTTTGEIIELRIATRKYPSKFKSLQDDFIAKFLRVKYQFAVGERVYKSKRLSLDIADRIYSDEELENDEFIKQVRSGQVTVRYIKFLPQVSVLTEPFQKGIDHVVFILGILMIMGVSFLFLSIAEQKVPTQNIISIRVAMPTRHWSRLADACGSAASRYAKRKL